MGILAFELIVGRPPFEKETRAATYEAIMYRRPSFPAWISNSAKDFITCALVKARHAPHEWIRNIDAESSARTCLSCSIPLGVLAALFLR